MKVTFRLRFHTHYGQSLWRAWANESRKQTPTTTTKAAETGETAPRREPPTLDREKEGSGKLLPLTYLNSDFWQVTVELADDAFSEQDVSYEYVLREADGAQTRDWGRPRSINLPRLKAAELLIIDSWNFPGYYANAFYTKAFKEVLLRPAPPQGSEDRRKEAADEAGQQTPNLERQTLNSEPGRGERRRHLFRVRAPLLPPHETLCLLGSGEVLGNWNTEQPRLMKRSPGNDWFELELDLKPSSFPIAYKYGVYDTGAARFVRFEDGHDRCLSEAHEAGWPTEDGAEGEKRASNLQPVVLLDDGFAALPMDAWRGAGVAIPVFGLRSEDSFGVGEFEDLKRLSDWAARTGLRMIQLLPVNDTTTDGSWRDSYPYSAISAFALHPLYVCLRKVLSEDHAALLQEFESERRRLNALEDVDYPAVMKLKERVLRRAYELEKERVFASAEYQTFHRENCEWLEPYAWFCFLRDRHGTVDFQAWSADQQYNAERLRQLAEAEPGVREAVEFFFFVQFHLDRQLREAAEYAHRLGVVLKGDLAIGVSRQGADVWEAPELFHLDMQAGAPPDAFAARGQNWGFPTYNWERMADDGYRWWGRRFTQMSRYFDAFRVDHILGFFRIWSIPQQAVEGVLGYFVPALPVRPGEFAARGIAFEAQRFIEPYITDDVLNAVFGEKAEWVKEYFLEPQGPAKYGLKPAFRTQAAVKAWFEKSESATSNLEARTASPEASGNGAWKNAAETSPLAGIGTEGARLKQGLFELLSNVLLLQEQPAGIPPAGPPASGGEGLHFRFGMDQTSAFQALDTATQSRLWDLYVDYFYRRQDRLWRAEGLKKLPWLKRATSLLVCGEDLGMVPDCVPEVMRELGILALEVQRMPKRAGHSFSRPADAGYLSVVTPSTHDMSPVREWWEQDRALTQRFYNDELGQPGEAPAECQPWICQAILEQHLRSPAMWSLFQLQDLLGMDATLRRPDAAAERINIPSDSAQRWRYRMHLNLETLLQAEEFNTRLAGMIRAAGRGH